MKIQSVANMWLSIEKDKDGDYIISMWDTDWHTCEWVIKQKDKRYLIALRNDIDKLIHKE